MAAILAARPAAAEEVRLNRVSSTLLEITGGSGSATWRLQYGTVSASVNAEIFAAAEPVVYFSHGTWLRAIDARQGTVIGRWRFPGIVVGVVQAGSRLEIRLDIREGDNGFDGPAFRTVLLDPQTPEIPYWPSGRMILYRVSEAEARTLLPLAAPVRRFPTAPLPADEAARLLPYAEDAVRRDPLSPWLRIARGKLLMDAGRPGARAAFAEAVQVPSTDFTELFPLSAYLERLGEPAAARVAFERAYGDFIARGNDPRLFTVLIGRLVLYHPFLDRGQIWTDAQRGEAIERLYRLAPGSEGADTAWRVHAAYLEKNGRREEAAVWRERADEARGHSLYLSNAPLLTFLDLLWLVVAASVLAALLLVCSLYVKYRPQRRLALAAQTRRFGFARGLSFFNLEYSSRRERLALLIIALAGWVAAGVGGGYLRGVGRTAASTLGLGTGSFAGPVTVWYFENRLPATPERDLLLAIARQQDGASEKAERLYRALPDFAESWNNLGVILRSRGKDQEARQAFDRALQLDPSLPEAAVNLGRPPTTPWTEAHHKYLPNRSMIAPPQREHIVRAFLGVSQSELYVRALGGPFVVAGQLRDLQITIKGPGPWFILFTPVAALAAAIALLFLVPSRDVTQAPGRMYRAWEWLVPGLPPAWGVLAGPALLAWSYFLLQMVLPLKYGTPRLLTAMAMPSLLGPYGIPPGAFSEFEFMNPNWVWMYGPPAVLFALNLTLVWRTGRPAESAAL